jgi:hypothetical protein
MTVNRKRPNISPDVFTEMSQLKKAEYFPWCIYWNDSQLKKAEYFPWCIYWNDR